MYEVKRIEDNGVGCGEEGKGKEMEDVIGEVKGEGDRIGGMMSWVMKGWGVGLGEGEERGERGLGI